MVAPLLLLTGCDEDAGVNIAVGLILGISAYCLPTIIAFSRKHNSAGAITAVNLLLGWSVAGWIASLVWSLTSNTKTAALRLQQQALAQAHPQAGAYQPASLAPPAADGLHRTRAGFVAAASAEVLERALRAQSIGDTAAITALTEAGKIVSLRQGVTVQVLGDEGPAATYVRFRPQGKTSVFWTVRNAIE